MSKELPVFKTAVVRKPGVRGCPYGLPISIACQNAGNSVDNMTAMADIAEEKRASQKKSNRRVYVFDQTGERCVYADRIVKSKDAVHCDYGEGGQRMRDFAIRPSPFYPRVFHGLGNYGLYSYRLDQYSDNVGSSQTFGGMLSMYAATGEIMINKSAMTPDPILTQIAAQSALTEHNMSINQNQSTDKA